MHAEWDPTCKHYIALISLFHQACQLAIKFLDEIFIAMLLAMTQTWFSADI